MSRNERITHKTTGFFSLLKIAGLKNLFLNLSTLIALISTLLFWYYNKNYNPDIQKLIDYYSDTVGSISATLLGIVIAGLAILIAVFQGKILGSLLKNRILQKFLFPFWFVTVMWGLSTFNCILLNTFSSINKNLLTIVLYFEIFIFVYSLFATISLMGHSIRVGLFLADLEAE
jgi:hypothetical protein